MSKLLFKNEAWSMKDELIFQRLVLFFIMKKGQNWLSWEPFNCSSYVKTISLLTAPPEETGNLFGHNMQLFLNYPIINTPTANWKGSVWILSNNSDVQIRGFIPNNNFWQKWRIWQFLKIDKLSFQLFIMF